MVLFESVEVNIWILVMMLWFWVLFLSCGVLVRLSPLFTYLSQWRFLVLFLKFPLIYTPTSLYIRLYRTGVGNIRIVVKPMFCLRMRVSRSNLIWWLSVKARISGHVARPLWYAIYLLTVNEMAKMIRHCMDKKILCGLDLIIQFYCSWSRKTEN